MFRNTYFSSAKQLSFVLRYLGQNAKPESWGVQHSYTLYTLERLGQTYTEVKSW